MKKEKKQHSNSLDLSTFDFRYDHVLVKARKSESVNGLIKPDQYEDKPEYGEVVAVGDGKLLDDGTVVPMDLKVGDIIFFGKYSSVHVRNGGDDFYVIRMEDVMAVKR